MYKIECDPQVRPSATNTWQRVPQIRGSAIQPTMPKRMPKRDRAEDKAVADDRAENKAAAEQRAEQLSTPKPVKRVRDRTDKVKAAIKKNAGEVKAAIKKNAAEAKQDKQRRIAYRPVRPHW
jgi:hypothetical protein